jgi:hypothetical protein
LSDQHGLRWRRRCYGAPPIYRLDQHRELRRRQRQRVIDNRWPDKARLLEPLGDQPQTTAVPIQALEIIAAPAAEEEEMAAERISTDHLLRLGGQAIEPVAQIDRTAGEEHLGAGREADHAIAFTARNTRDSAFSLTKASTLTRAPFGSAISIDPALPSAVADGVDSGDGDANVPVPLDVDVGPSMRPIGTNSTVSAAPIATAAALRDDRQL